MQRQADVAGATLGALKAAKDISDTMPKKSAQQVCYGYSPLVTLQMTWWCIQKLCIQ
jgi:hypothetical protein